MADTNPLEALKGFFFANDMNDPRVNSKLRERIAYQMMQNKRPYPKTVGEGLSAIGDALAQRGMMDQLARSDIAAQEQSRRDLAGGGGGGAGPTSGYQGDNSAITGAQPVVAGSRVTAPGPLPPSQRAVPTDYGNIDGPSPLDPPSGADRDQAVRTLVTEAGNQGPEGQAAVANVIRNRAIQGGYGGRTAGAVATAPGQFEGVPRNPSVDPNSPAYAAAGAALDSAYAGNDPTRGAVNFLNPKLQADLGRKQPAWAPPGQGQRIGDHVFYGGAPPPDPRAAVTQAVVNQQNGPAVPPPNPTQSGAAALPQVASLGQVPTGSLPPGGAEASQQQITPLPPQRQITPRPVQVAQAQGQPDAIRGYVPPPIEEPTPPQQTPMHPREHYLRKLVATSNNDYTKAAATEELQLWQAQRTNLDARNEELHKKRLDYYNNYNMERTKALIDQQRRIDESLKAEDERNKPTDVKNKMVRNSDGSYSPVRITGLDPNAPPTADLSESQSKTLTNHGRASLGHEALKGKEQLLAEGGVQEATGKIPFFGNKLQENRYKLAKNAADNFVQAFIRQTSGGAYGAAELELEARAMLPKFGDTPQQLEQKRQQRERFINGMYGGLGPDGQRVADHYAKKDKAEAQAKQEAIAKEMSGVEKVVGKPYRKGNRVRVWTGSEWEEH